MLLMNKFNLDDNVINNNSLNNKTKSDALTTYINYYSNISEYFETKYNLLEIFGLSVMLYLNQTDKITIDDIHMCLPQILAYICILMSIIYYLSIY